MITTSPAARPQEPARLTRIRHRLRIPLAGSCAKHMPCRLPRTRLAGDLRRNRLSRLCRAAAMGRRVRGPEAQRRALVTCGVLLLVIALFTAGLAWTIWSVTVERQAKAQQRPSAPDSALEGELTADLTTAHRKGSAKEPARPGPGDKESASAPSSAAPGGAGLPGPLVGGVGASAVCLAGLFAGRRVLRRYRAARDGEEDRSSRPCAEHSPSRATSDDAVATAPPTGETFELEADHTEASAGPEATRQQDAPAEAAAGDVSGQNTTTAVLTPTAWPASFDARAPDGPIPMRVEDVRDPSSYPVQRDGEDGRRLDQPQNLLVSSARGVMQNTTAVDAASSLVTEPATQDKQRLYERRATPRVDYVVEAIIELPDARLPVTVLDLSETGVRCQVPQLPPAVRLSNGDYLRVAFPAGSSVVNAKARVAWRRSNNENLQVGLTFVGLSPQDRSCVRAVVAAQSTD